MRSFKLHYELEVWLSSKGTWRRNREKAGQMVGNLMELQFINIYFLPDTDENDDDEDGDEAPSPDWGTLSRILRYLRRTVALWSSGDDCYAGVEEIQGLARVIHDHPMISQLTILGCNFENFGPWCSALATLPSLKSVTFGLHEPETQDQRVLVNPEPLTELLRTPALRSIAFEDFSFTSYTLCYAVANALEEGSSITDITFDCGCSFPDGGIAIITNALKTNATITNAQFYGDFDESFFNSLAVVLICNSTLQNLTLHAVTRAKVRWISSLFLSLGMNTALKSLTVGRQVGG
jgi:hypothetical protein